MKLPLALVTLATFSLSASALLTSHLWDLLECVNKVRAGYAAYSFAIKYYPDDIGIHVSALFDLLLVTNGATYEAEKLRVLDNDDFLGFFLTFSDINDGTQEVLKRAVEAAPQIAPEDRESIAHGLEEQAGTLDRFGLQICAKVPAEHIELTYALFDLMINGTLEAASAIRG